MLSPKLPPTGHPYNPAYHVESIREDSEGHRIVVTHTKFPDGQALCFRILLDEPGRCYVTDDGAIVAQLGKEDHGCGERYFNDVQYEHWKALNFICKTRFGDGPACATSIDAAGPDLNSALMKIIDAARNFIVAGLKGNHEHPSLILPQQRKDTGT